MVAGAHAFGERVWRNARSVRHLIGVWRKTISVCIWLGAGRVAGNVARPNDHGKHEFIRAVFVLQSLDIADRNLDLFAGKNVGDRLREDVWPFLIQKASSLATGLRGLVDGLGFFTPQNLSAHRAIADEHGHVIDRSVLWQRKGVNGFDLFLEWVFKFLRDNGARQESPDLRLHIRVFERTDSFGFSIWIDDLKQALGLAALR